MFNKQLLPLRLFIKQRGLCVGGRISLSQQPYQRCHHPLIIFGKQPLTKLIIHSEHLRLIHADSTHVVASLARHFHIQGARRIVHFIIHDYVICRLAASETCLELLSQLPPDQLNPSPMFDQVGVDYTGPVLVKSGSPRKPLISKAYVCIFVSITVKAVDLEPVSELTTPTFIATLQRFMA